MDPRHRGKGVASSAIEAAETIVQGMPGYTAICMDVAPRNGDALRLYHRLGTNGLGLITLRKELAKRERDKQIRLFGLDYLC